jgi:hypothetical protein
MKLRRDPDSYAWMLDNIAPLIVGSGKYKEEYRRQLPTKWMTPSSEAFAILCLENYYHNIQDQASNKSTIRKPLWTNKGVAARRNQGWSLEGLIQFEKNCKAVQMDREKASSKKVDLDYWKVKLSKVDKKEERKRKREETRDKRELGWNVAHADEWSEEEEANQQNVENGREQEVSGNDQEEESNNEGDSIH